MAKHLVAYVTTDSEEEDFIEQIRSYLNHQLPDYMLPSAFVLLDRLPLTTNGKVDHKALPEPDFSEQQVTYVPPRTEAEAILCEIWQEMLGVERVGANDNFFQLGGNSFLALKVIRILRHKFKTDFTLHVIFSHPVLTDLAVALYSFNSMVADFEICNLMKPGSNLDQALFVIHPLGGTVFSYQELIDQLSTDIPVFGVSHPMLVNDAEEIAGQELKDLAAYHVNYIRRHYPGISYAFIGWSMGGVLALEIATQMLAKGEKVVYLGMIDSVWRVRRWEALSETEMAASELMVYFDRLKRSEHYDLQQALDFLEIDKNLGKEFDENFDISGQSLATGKTLREIRAMIISDRIRLERYSGSTSTDVREFQYFSATQNKSDYKTECLEWMSQSCSRKPNVIEVSGDHQSIIHAPIVDEICKQIDSALTRVFRFSSQTSKNVLEATEV